MLYFCDTFKETGDMEVSYWFEQKIAAIVYSVRYVQILCNPLSSNYIPALPSNVYEYKLCVHMPISTFDKTRK